MLLLVFRSILDFLRYLAAGFFLLGPLKGFLVRYVQRIRGILGVPFYLAKGVPALGFSFHSFDVLLPTLFAQSPLLQLLTALYHLAYCGIVPFVGDVFRRGYTQFFSDLTVGQPIDV